MSQVIEFVVGQKVWQGHGLMGGKDVDDASSGYYEYKFEALTAISDEWQAWLSDSEKTRTSVYVRQYRIESLDDDGSIGCAVTCD